MGVEASAEIQAAARRVLDENRRLRALLKQRGLTDEEIEAYTEQQSENPQYPSPSAALELMLEARRHISGQTSSGSRSGKEVLDSGYQSISPRVLPPQQIFTSYSTVNPVLASPRSATTAGSAPLSTPTSGSFGTHVPFNPPGGIHNNQYPIPSYNYGDPSNAHWLMPQASGAIDERLDLDNASSCFHAANIIRNMRSDIGAELEADLGCARTGEECKVNNTVVFDVMDKYSSRGMQ